MLQRTRIVPFLVSITALSEALLGSDAAAAEAVITAVAPEEADAAGDPNLDRGFLLPTGETQPAGSLVFHSTELVLAGLSYGVTDWAQVTVTGLVPVRADLPTLVNGMGKFRFVSTDRLRVALHGSVTYEEQGEESSYLLTSGATASFCLDDPCHSQLSGTVGALDRRGHSERLSGPLYGATLSYRLGRRVKLLAELAGATIEHDGQQRDSHYALNYGLRIFASQVAVDFGLVMPLVEAARDDTAVGYPFVALGYRAL